MEKQKLIMICSVILIFFSNQNALCEEIFTKNKISSFQYKWNNQESGSQSIRLLFPTDEGAINPDKSDVIEWMWEKSKKGWSGWGMQWNGWNIPIDLFTIVKYKGSRAISSATAMKFDKIAKFFNLQFKVKGYISDPLHSNSIKVRFDGVGDQPSEEIAFLSHLYDSNNKKVEMLSKDEFYTVNISLDNFQIIRSRIDASKIKQIVFNTPNKNNTKGRLLYTILKLLV